MKKQTLTRFLPYLCAALLGAVTWMAPRVLRTEDSRRLAVCLFLLGILSLLLRNRDPSLLLRRCSMADALAFLLAGIAIFPRYHHMRTVFPVVTGAMFLTEGITALNVSRFLGQCGDRKWLYFALLSFMVILAAIYLLLVLILRTDPAIRTVGAVMLGTAILKIFLMRRVIQL